MKAVTDAIRQRHRVVIRVAAAGIGTIASSSLFKIFLADCAHVARAGRDRAKERIVACAVVCEEYMQSDIRRKKFHKTLEILLD